MWRPATTMAAPPTVTTVMLLLMLLHRSESVVQLVTAPANNSNTKPQQAPAGKK